MPKNDEKLEAKDELSSEAKDKDIYKDVLWGMYQEHQVNARHHETQRSTANNFIILVAGGIGTLVSAGGLTEDDLPLTILLIVLGLYGAVFSASHFERYQRHKVRADAYRDELDKLLFTESETSRQVNNYRESLEIAGRKTLKQTKNCADYQRDYKHPILNRIRKMSVHWLWFFLPLIVAGLGFVLSFQAAGKKTTPAKVIVGTDSPLKIERTK